MLIISLFVFETVVNQSDELTHQPLHFLPPGGIVLVRSVCPGIFYQSQLRKFRFEVVSAVDELVQNLVFVFHVLHENLLLNEDLLENLEVDFTVNAVNNGSNQLQVVQGNLIYLSVESVLLRFEEYFFNEHLRDDEGTYHKHLLPLTKILKGVTGIEV